MIITDAELLERIEAFLDRTGMKPTRFGRDAMREASLVSSLQGGRSLSLTNVNRVLKFMADHDALAAETSDADSDIVVLPPLHPAAPAGEAGIGFDHGAERADAKVPTGIDVPHHGARSTAEAGAGS